VIEKIVWLREMARVGKLRKILRKLEGNISEKRAFWELWAVRNCELRILHKKFVCGLSFHDLIFRF